VLDPVPIERRDAIAGRSHQLRAPGDR